MLRVMIVDDEPTIRQGIIASIDWSQYEIEIVGEASNGKEALERAPDLDPQIIITDIRMPVMDGLELTRELKKMLSETKIVILSGYDDFGYAKQALRLGVCEYLLKPVGAEELIALLLKLKNDIQVETAQKIQAESARKLLSENLLLLQSEFIQATLKGTFNDPDLVLPKAAQLNIDFTGPFYQVVIIDIDDYLLQTEDMTEKEQAAMKSAVLNTAQTVLASKGRGLFCLSEFDYLIGLINGTQGEMDIILELYRTIQAEIKQSLKLTVTFGIGRAYGKLTEIPCSYRESIVCLRKKIFKGKEQMIVFEPEWLQLTTRPLIYPTADEKELLGQLKLMEGQQVTAIIEKIFNHLLVAIAGPEDLKSFCVKFIIIAMNSLEELGVDLEKHLGKNFEPYKEIDKYETLEDIKIWLNNLLQFFIQIIKETKNEKYKGIVKLAIQFIQEHYHEDINLADITSTVFVTPNYLSRVFKEQTGESLIDWLNRFRIEKAKTLLLDFQIKIYEIAEKVGYNDYKYFSHIFKKYTGMTPKEYRDLNAT